MPLHRRVPKRGFTNIFKKEYHVINIWKFEKLEGSEFGPEELVALGLARPGSQIKVLGDGELKRAVKIRAHKFSHEAGLKIEAAGGSWEVIAS